ncbi:MAG: M20/M25/M40 family metallo-hydrolase, partial [Methylobacteriaceae bacterium]|nr:M20/M25/M40 family metallo-hydrolase [Methylobacteriaceae bacterium]
MLDRVLGDIDTDLENSLARLFDWLRIASISTDPAYAGECRRAAEWVRGDLESLGFQASLRETEGSHPVVLAHAPKPGTPHVLFYGHYDVQPVDPLELWEAPPFEPRTDKLDGGREVIRARGACDDKGQVMTFLEACRAWKATAGELPVGITVLIEGAEENGSKGLPEWLVQNKERLKAEVALVCDTG